MRPMQYAADQWKLPALASQRRLQSKITTYGMNGLSHRIAQHRTFSHIDPDRVAITKDIGWQETSQWMDVVARTGTSLFLSRTRSYYS